MIALLSGCQADSAEHASIENHPTVNARSSSLTIRKGSIHTVSTKQLNSNVRISGSVTPRSVVTLSSQIPGRIVYLGGREGDPASPGQIMIELVREDIRAQHRAAWASLAEANAVLQDANVQLYRKNHAPYAMGQGPMDMMNMFNQFFMMPAANMAGIGSSRAARYADYNRVRSGVERALAGVMRAQSRVDEVESLLLETRVLAPLHGVVLSRHVEVGDFIQPGQPLLTISDPMDLLIRAEIPVSIALGLRPGQLIPASMDQDLPDIEVLLERVYPSADPVRQTVTADFAVSPETPVAPGMYAVLDLVDPTSSEVSLPVIPTDAVTLRGNQHIVTVAGVDMEPEIRVVRTGERTESGISILSGLSAGEQIILPAPSARSSF